MYLMYPVSIKPVKIKYQGLLDDWSVVTWGNKLQNKCTHEVKFEINILLMLAYVIADYVFSSMCDKLNHSLGCITM